MSALLNPRKRKLFEGQTLSPWASNFLTPWNAMFFNTGLDSLTRFEDFIDPDSHMPAMNIEERKNNFKIEFAAPGFDKKDFEVTIEDDVLHVSGEKEQEEGNNDDNFSRKEFNYTTFKRSMALPVSVDLDQDVKASYKNGILKIKLSKLEAVDHKQASKKVIEVH
ncbi:Hsp20/alpha crystallin family protein [Oceanihabitans sp. IOP_32]|uniref:Hsp20/alpha crystallin family protein n=1 Tax=Oceanihabitans sp. IOP_32 TaxID=2529032 RepID=UPI0012939CDE|nr:Hsp20/alpha crystallin family protein [Oceanihabitans sp. IOP_32]QFZ53671.1 Hsp20/alpha crystallin family protein [Oceanihabitans sp. IOP_32]